MNIDELKNLLRHYRLKPNFTYGQNFLVDKVILQDIVDAAQVSCADNILEIGPGIGNLTRLLCERALHQSPQGGSGAGQAGFVLSIEKDPKFFPILKSIKKDYKNNFRFEIADALEYDFVGEFNKRYQSTNQHTNDTNLDSYHSHGIREFVSPYKVVANIPYFITGKILKMLMTAEFKPSLIVVLTQKEVAQNIIAKPGKLSVLAISVQLYGQPEIVQIVPAKSFYPAPKVDSAVVRIKLFPEPKYIIADEKKFFKIVKACFAGKRKQIHNTLMNNLRLDKHRVEEILLSLKINPAARPQELSIEQWIELAQQLT